MLQSVGERSAGGEDTRRVPALEDQHGFAVSKKINHSSFTIEFGHGQHRGDHYGPTLDSDDRHDLVRLDRSIRTIK
jgi:hypothetical protein